MYELKVVTQFSAAHQLRNFGGKCEELHGHNWKIEVIVRGEKLDSAGLLIDFKELKEYTNKILEKLDHTYLNELPFFRNQNPTSESIAAYIFEKLSDTLQSNHIEVTKVTAWESDTASASYIRDNTLAL